MAVVATSTRSTFEPVTFKLSGQIVVHKKGPTDELVLNMPTASAFIKHGMPYIEKAEGDYPNVVRTYEFNFKSIMGFLQEMTGHDEIVLSGIPGNDMIPLATMVVNILSFRPKAAGSSPGSSETSTD